MIPLLPRDVDVDGPSGTPSGRARPTNPLWIGTSWKMTKTLAESQAYAEDLVARPVPDGVQAFVLPPLTALHTVLAARPAGSDLLVGVQNAHWASDGPVTGEVSMRQVRDAGAQIVEIGHSDRRGQFGETDQVVAAKVTAALEQHLVPLVCVGEPWSVRSAGHAEEHVADQVRTALAGVAPADLSTVLVAYEPVWAIGEGGRAATPVDVVGVLDRIRAVVAGLAPAARLRALLYGGSVSTDNAADLLRLEQLDGLFVGRAAWTVDGLAALLALGGQAAAERAQTTPTHEQRSR